MTSMTPDFDAGDELEVVEEIGREIGLTYEEDEPLQAGRKEAERDRHRWELDPPRPTTGATACTTTPATPSRSCTWDMRTVRGVPETAKRTAVIVAAALLVTFFIADGRREAAPRRVAYSELLTAVDRNEVTEVRIAERELVATLAGPERGEPLRIAATRIPGIDESQLLTRLEQHNVKFSGRLPATPAAYLPLLFVGGLCLLFPLLRRRSYDKGQGGTSWQKVPVLARKPRSRNRIRRSRFHAPAV